MGRIIAVALGLLVLVGVGAFGFFYVRGESLIVRGVEQEGSKAVGAAVRLGGAGLNVLAGSAGLRGFAIANPAGFSNADAIAVDEIAVRLDPMSVFSDTIEIDEIKIAAPSILVEVAGTGATNLQTLQKNVAAGGGESDAPSSQSGQSASPNLIVRRFALTGARLGFSGSELGLDDQSLTLPDIILRDIGVQDGGVPPEQLVRVISEAVMPQIQKALASQQGKALLDKVTRGRLDLDKGVKENITEKAGEALKGLLKRGD